MLANGAAGQQDARRQNFATLAADWPAQAQCSAPAGRASMIGKALVRLRPSAIALWHKVQGPARLVLLVVVVVRLTTLLNGIGWGALARNLPGNPWFYVIFIVNYCGLPFYETIIYNWLWHTGARVLPALLRKRVYNEAVLEYSGESALFMWAKNHTDVGDGELARNVRDVNILSTLAGNLVTFLVLAAVISTVVGRLGASDAAMLRRGMLFVGGLVVVLLGLIAVFGKRFLALPLGKSAGVSGLHLLRLFTYMGLLALQWHVAVPQVGWKPWAIFIALQMAVSRLPLIPAKDLFFTGLAVKLSQAHPELHVAATPAILAGLFVASSGLNLLVHGVMYAVGHLAGVKPPEAKIMVEVGPAHGPAESGAT